MATPVEIAGRRLAPDSPAYLIAEIGQNHDGSLGLAHSYIDAAAKAGADAVKFQTHIAAAESSREDQWRIKFSLQDETRYDYWQRMEFTAEQWAGLKEHCDDAGVTFLSSAFSVQAVELLANLGMPAWKIGSGEFRSKTLMAAMKATGRPLLYSTGMSRWDEIDAVVAGLQAEDHPFGLFQCTSAYPTTLRQIGLNVLDEMKSRYPGVPVGLSDHSGEVHPSFGALARGADMLELHFTFDKGMFGPDVVASLTPKQFAEVSAMRNAIAEMDAHPIDKDAMAGDLSDMRALFTKSVAPTRDLAAGEILTLDMICPKKPGTGIPFENHASVLGKRTRRAIPLDELIRPEDLEDTDA